MDQWAKNHTNYARFLSKIVLKAQPFCNIRPTATEMLKEGNQTKSAQEGSPLGHRAPGAEDGAMQLHREEGDAHIGNQVCVCF